MLAICGHRCYTYCVRQVIWDGRCSECHIPVNINDIIITEEVRIVAEAAAALDFDFEREMDALEREIDALHLEEAVGPQI